MLSSSLRASEIAALRVGNYLLGYGQASLVVRQSRGAGPEPTPWRRPLETRNRMGEVLRVRPAVAPQVWELGCELLRISERILQI